MPPSRRRIIELASTAAVPFAAGCSGQFRRDATAPSSGQTDTATTPTSLVAVRLVGPETDVRLFDAADVETTGAIRTGGSGVVLPTELTPDATTRVGETLRAAGVDEEPAAFEFVLRYDGERTNRFAVGRSFAESLADGEWTGRFVLSFEERSRAERIKKALATVDGSETARTTESGTTTRPPASEALVVRSVTPVEGTMVNLGATGTAENTASVALVACIVEATGTVGGRTFDGQAHRDRIEPGETWEWEVAFGEEADAMDDDAVENLSVSTMAKYAT